jgi:hypothetical protein
MVSLGSFKGPFDSPFSGELEGGVFPLRHCAILSVFWEVAAVKFASVRTLYASGVERSSSISSIHRQEALTSARPLYPACDDTDSPPWNRP